MPTTFSGAGPHVGQLFKDDIHIKMFDKLQSVLRTRTRIRILLVTLMWMRIRILLFTLLRSRTRILAFK